MTSARLARLLRQRGGEVPRIDQPAARGVRLTDFHSNGLMCSPTRAALLTGRCPQHCAWVPDEELSGVAGFGLVLRVVHSQRAVEHADEQDDSREHGDADDAGHPVGHRRVGFHPARGEVQDEAEQDAGSGDDGLAKGLELVLQG
jgi:hypothetical protein